jgi:ribosomal protein S6--L-glutamate ligase
VVLDSEYEKIALTAARLMDLDVAGVDLLESSSGPLVAEVNSSPGLEGIETTTGVDAAGAIIEHLQSSVRPRLQASRATMRRPRLVRFPAARG